MKLFFGIFILLLSVISCGPKDYCQKVYDLDFPIKITSQDTFEIGDTIWVTIKIDSLLDKNSGNYINFAHYPLQWRIDFNRLGSGGIVYASDNFDTVLDTGTIALNDVTFINSNNSIRIGYLPKKTGKFHTIIELNNAIKEREGTSGPWRGRPGSMLITPNENCYELLSDEFRPVVNNDSVNLRLVYGRYKGIWNGKKQYFGTIENDFNSGNYAFVVKP